MSDIPLPTVGLLRQSVTPTADGTGLIWRERTGKGSGWWNEKVAGKAAFVAKRDQNLRGHPYYGTFSGCRVYLHEALHAVAHGQWPDADIDWTKRQHGGAKGARKPLSFPNNGLLEAFANGDCMIGWSCGDQCWFTEVYVAADGSADVAYHDSFDDAVAAFKAAFEPLDLI